MIDSEEIGKKITRFRKEKGMKQSELAEKVFISNTYMSYIEKGRKNPTTAVLSDIADALGITLDQLVKGDGDNKAEPETLSEITKDCDSFEAMVITETAEELKKILRRCRNKMR